MILQESSRLREQAQRKNKDVNQDLLLYVNMYLEGFVEFQVKPQFRSIQVSDEDWKQLVILKRFLLQS